MVTQQTRETEKSISPWDVKQLKTVEPHRLQKAQFEAIKHVCYKLA